MFFTYLQNQLITKKLLACILKQFLEAITICLVLLLLQQLVCLKIHLMKQKNMSPLTFPFHTIHGWVSSKYTFWYSLSFNSSILEQGFYSTHHLQMTSSEGFQQNFSIISKFGCCGFYMRKNVGFTLISFAVLK